MSCRNLGASRKAYGMRMYMNLFFVLVFQVGSFKHASKNSHRWEAVQMSAVSVLGLSEGHDHPSLANSHSQQLIFLFRSHEWWEHDHTDVNILRTHSGREDDQVRVFQAAILIFQLCTRVTNSVVAGTEPGLAECSLAATIFLIKSNYHSYKVNNAAKNIFKVKNMIFSTHKSTRIAVQSLK